MAITTHPDTVAELVETCPSALELATLTLLAALVCVGLGVLFFLWLFAGSLWEELSEGDGESLLFDGSDAEYPWTLFM